MEKTASEKIELLQERLELEKEKKELIFSLYDDWIYEYNIEEQRLVTISGISAEYKLSERERTRRNYLQFEGVHPEDKDDFERGCYGREDSSKPLTVEVRILVHEEYRWISLTTRVLTDKKGKPVCIIGKISDVDEKKREELQLREKATQDAMTKLLNREAFKERVEKTLKKAKEDEQQDSAILLLDIDKFKNVNDTYGHLYGDTVIVGMAEVLQKVFHEKGMVGRFGGDEFTVFLPHTNQEQLTLLICELRETFAKEFAETAEQVKISCSVGAALYGESGTTLEELLSSADSALYFVKENGRDNFAFCTKEIKKRFLSGQRKEDMDERSPSNMLVLADITEFAMELLENSKEFKSSLNMLLLKVGKQFKLAGTVIQEYNEKGVLVLSYVWKNKEKEIKETKKNYVSLQERSRIREQYKQYEMIEISDIEKLPKNSDMYLSWEETGIQSLFQCPLSHEGTVFGYIVYMDTVVRTWSESEKKSLVMISRIIGNYLARERAYQQIERKVELIKSFDEVTGLLKYDKFLEVVRSVLKQEGNLQYALISIDFANFKYFNEIYGFENGDIILEEFANFIAKRNPRVVAACRDYADNFIILAIVKSEAYLVQNITNYTSSFVKNQMEHYSACRLEVYSGIYVITNPNIDILQAIDNARLAKKILKEKQTPGTLMFQTEMKRKRIQDAFVLHMIEEGLQLKKFHFYLQPKISLETGELVGAEALARWEKKNGEIVTPSEFILPLEQSGKIVHLDFYMFESVLQQMKQWKQMGYPLIPISVNFSRQHIKTGGLVERLVELQQEYQIESSLIEIEITESAFVEDQQALIELMKKLKQQGFSISIDDFGTGYSSFSMLTQVPADIVKLDKEFLCHNESDSTKKMLQNVICLIKDNQMKVLCEGIEEKEQMEFLQQAGCDIGQGYYFSKPIPVEIFEKKYFSQ
mgnify:CR=1 FL=1